LIKSETSPYAEKLKSRLAGAHKLDGLQLMLLHNEYGVYIGKQVNRFLETTNIRPDLVASHGHTVFHQPQEYFTCQIGSGANIAATCGLTTVCDFRTLDVALGGQGAPLVPVGDRVLFGKYDFCLNLGGFANISNEQNGHRIANDICPANIVTNQLASRLGFEYDQDGRLGSEGHVNDDLVHELNNLAFYEKPAPKSLGREWVDSTFLPVLYKYDLSVNDLLASCYEHIAIQICRYINKYKQGKVLVTGGGAFNKYLLKIMGLKSKSSLVIPDENTVKYKEAIIFAFLGILRLRNEVNCLSSVTGAQADSSSGIVYEATK
jgi:anhydro-N-acetylmuramic acid kinase